MSTHADVCIVGGGPTGAIAARMLANLGRSVILVTGSRSRYPLPEETLVPGAAAVIERVGLRSLFARNRWFGTPRHGILWGDDTTHWREGGDDTRGFQVERRVLDAESVNAAERAGTVLADTPVAAKVQVLATGKDAPPAAATVHTQEHLPATVALIARIQSKHSIDSTLIESVPEGWWWWLPLRGGDVALTLFADADEVRSMGREAVWENARKSARGPARTSDASPGAALVATPRLRNSSSSWVLAGDAASSIDPLSSQGLEKALASAEMAAHVAHTLCSRPDDRDRLLVFHRNWERGLFLAHARRTLSLYARERRFPDAPFWRARHAAARTWISETPFDQLPGRMRRADNVQDTELWRPSEGALLQPTPALQIGAEGTPVDRLAAVPLQPLLDHCASATTPDQVVAAAAENRDLYLSSPSRIREALREALRLGFLVPA